MTMYFKCSYRKQYFMHKPRVCAVSGILFSKSGYYKWSMARQMLWDRRNYALLLILEREEIWCIFIDIFCQRKYFLFVSFYCHDASSWVLGPVSAMWIYISDCFSNEYCIFKLLPFCNIYYIFEIVLLVNWCKLYSTYYCHF